MSWQEYCILEKTMKETKTNSEISVHDGTTVTLLDIKYNEELVYTLVSQSHKTHYKGYYFKDGHYNQRTERVLDSGGDGVTTISIESPLGHALLGHKKGATVSFKNNVGEEETFKILNIRKC